MPVPGVLEDHDGGVLLSASNAGPQWDGLISDLFEKITLFDNRVVNATAKKRPDGKYDVTRKVHAGAFYQILTRCSGGRYSLSPGLTPYASYQASILRKGPSTRKRAGG